MTRGSDDPEDAPTARADDVALRTTARAGALRPAEPAAATDPAAPSDVETQGSDPAAPLDAGPRGSEPEVSVEVAHAARAAIDPLARDVARAQAAAALFGRTTPVTVGRYRLIERVGAGGMGVVWSAFDPELGRPVALKLASSGSEDARDRARTEGRALARLSHPHVVPIYDVVDTAQGVFLVMELVRGQTLRAYAAEARPRAIVAAYREAALGLAAAHQAGLVHRDFKPDNAVVGADHRVRVLDFGLAHDDDGRAATIAGTPRYMAPEQRLGALSPAVDQYALCASLREALGASAPRWLGPILARGTAAAPEARFTSMTALAAALGRDPAAVWRRRGVGALALVAVGIGVVVGRGQAAPPGPSCDGGAALIAASWSDARLARLVHLDALAGPYAPVARTQLVSALDDYAGQWRLVHRASCQAHARGELSTPLFDRRTECLARARTALATVGRLTADVTTDQLAALIEAAAALPALARCGDDDALATPVAPPPVDAAGRVAAVELQLAELAVLRDAGRVDDARALAAAAVTAAEAIAYPPLVAHALLARGRIELSAAAADRGAADFARATRLALAAGDDRLAVEAYARDAFARATGDGARAPMDGLTLIEPLAERLPARDAFAVALLQSNLGAIALAAGDRAAAHPHFDRAATIADRLEGPERVELIAPLTGQLLVLDDLEARRERGAALVARQTALFGPAHPLPLRLRILVAQLEEDIGLVRIELAPPCAALAEQHPSLGARYAGCASELALLAALDGDDAEVRRWAALAEATSAHGAMPLHAARARAFHALGEGRPAEALAGFRAARTELGIDATSAWFDAAHALDTALAAALAGLRAGDQAAARAELAIASALLARVAPSMPPPIAKRRAQVLTALSMRAAPTP